MKLSRFSAAWVIATAFTSAAFSQVNPDIAALRTKAEAGNGIAQYNLGLAYTRGDEIPANPTEAFVWLSLAHENGARGPALESLTSAMDAATLASAQRELAQRRASLTSSSTPTTVAGPVASLKPDQRLQAERDALSAKLNDLVAEIAVLREERAQHAKTAADQTQAAEAAKEQLQRVQQQLAAASSAPIKADAAPAHPDLSNRVRELEAQLADATRSPRPAYPDLSARVKELETALTEARAQSQPQPTSSPAASKPIESADASTSPTDVEALQKKLAETEDKLATALRGYAFLQRQTNEKAAASAKANDAILAERNDAVTRLADTDSRATVARNEATRLKDELAMLRESLDKESSELAATRDLLEQVRASQALLAQENYALKARLSPHPSARNSTSRATPETVAIFPEQADKPSDSSTDATPAAAPRTHVVEMGDSLSKIAEAYYGDSKRWPEIYEANRATLAGARTLAVGTILTIP